MDTRQYQQEVMRTCGASTKADRLVLSALGMSGEVGEIVEHIKKAIFHQHPIDEQQLKLEIGDLLWYVALLCATIDVSLEEAMAANLKKLRKRYPDGFDEQRSINREG